MSDKRNKERRPKAPALGGMEQVDDGLPKSSDARAILRERAAALASRPEEESSEPGVQYIHVRLGRGEEYGIPYHYAEEILPMQKITRVPGIPGLFAGVTNRRGEMLAVIDLKSLLGLSQDDSPGGRDAGIVVVRGGGLTIGLAVDDVVGNDEYRPSELAAALPSEGFTNLEWVEGICEGRIAILNLDKVLTDSRVSTGSRV